MIMEDLIRELSSEWPIEELHLRLTLGQGIIQACLSIMLPWEWDDNSRKSLDKSINLQDN